MCECCSQKAAGHQGHIHVNSVDCDDCFKELEGILNDLPGIINVEYVKDAEQAKIVFDKRIIEVTGLEKVLDKNGFAVS